MSLPPAFLNILIPLDKDNADDMISQQLDQLNNKDPNQSFIQYWTLTQQVSDVVECPLNPSKSILNLATTARPRIFQTLYPYVVQKKLIPGVLLVDDSGKSDELVALALSLNLQVLS